ncbi:large proline-rich protein bag6-B-like isoform X1 [Fagus crenata]
MADQYSNEGSSAGNVSGKSSDSTVELNIKTLDSQIYSFQVNKNMPVSSFKEKIANEIGVPVGQQRLIFRGRVLKDDHLLSEYHVENGHTLHLVERQPVQSQPSSGTGTGETTGNDGNRGNDSSAGNPRNRIGQISHSVVLGTFNVGDQSEGVVPDLSRVIGAVLNSIGLGGQATTVGTSGTQSATSPNAPGQPPQGNETERMRGNIAGQTQTGNQAQSGQAFSSQPFQSLPQVVQIPLAAAAVPVPSLHMPIPDSLSTLSEFMNRMEQTLSQNGYQPNSSSANPRDLPRVELPSSAQGMPTPEALSIVLHHAERLLSGHAVAALSHIAGRLEQEGSSSDPTIRGQIQAESMQLGIAMQHLGALLLELGRTTLTLRMGQSPADSVVNAGPAVYISPSGPNPIMVQPFPFQASSLFGGSVPQSNPVTFGPVGIGNAPRHINIHIHAGTSLAPMVSGVGTRASNVEGTQGERRNGAGSGDSGATRVLPMRSVIATAVPRPSSVASSGAAQPGLVSVSQPPSDSVSLSAVMSGVNSRIRNFVGSLQGDNMVSLGQAESTVQRSSGESGAGSDVGNEQPNTSTVNLVNRVRESDASVSGSIPESEGQKLDIKCDQLSNNDASTGLKDVSASGSSLSCLSGGTVAKSEDSQENALRSGEKRDTTEGDKAVPLGLGLAGLERKRRGRQQKSQAMGGDGGTTSAPVDQSRQIRASGQQLLQSLASLSSSVNSMNATEQPLGQLPSVVGQVMDSRPLGGQGSDDQIDMASVMSQVLQTPALNGLLAGVSEQTGAGSPDVLRNMLQQFTESPQMRNTINQIAQQVDTQDLGNMFAGLGTGQGGGLDLSRMFQQMMPVVSRALSGGSIPSQLFPAVDAATQPDYNERRLSKDDKPNEQNVQINLQQVAQRIEHLNPPENVFRSVVENAVQLSGSESGSEDLVDELCSDEGLTNEYIEMLRHDLIRRLQGDSGQDNC